MVCDLIGVIFWYPATWLLSAPVASHPCTEEALLGIVQEPRHLQKSNTANLIFYCYALETLSSNCFTVSTVSPRQGDTVALYKLIHSCYRPMYCPGPAAQRHGADHRIEQ